MSLIVQNLGLIDYGDAWREQLSVHAAVANGDPERLLVCQHPLVITLGRVTPESDILDRSVAVFEVERGGKATIHMPGQLVVYPIIDLKKRGKDLRGYLRALEDAVIRCLAEFQITALAIDGKTGVWVEDRKIASIGVAVSKWVTFHGIAFNVDCKLKAFSAINPCGFSASVMTSVENEMKTLGSPVPPDLFLRSEKRVVEILSERLVSQRRKPPARPESQSKSLLEKAEKSAFGP